MRIALVCGGVGAATVLGPALWSSAGSLYRYPSAERLLLVEFPVLLLAASAAGGLFLIGRGWPHREGRGLCCACCGHPWSPETSRLHSNCQECGAPWRWFGGRVPGRPVVRPSFLMTGAVLCLFSLAVVIVRETAAQRLASSSPTWLLIRAVGLKQVHESRVEWDTLMARTLSPADEEALARTTLQKRLKERSIPAPLASWFDLAAQGGSIPRSLIDRWYEEMFEVRLSAPARAVVGERVQVLVRAQYLGGWLGLTDQAQVVVAEVGDGRGAVRSEARVLPASVFARAETLAEQAVVPEDAGPLTVRVRGYFFIGPPTGRVEFGPDGAPGVGRAVYVREFDLEQVVDVEPAPEER